MTAVEELIKEMQQLKDTKLYQGSFKAIDDCIHLAYAKLELEKEQIVMAIDYIYFDEDGNEMTGEDYYNTTFKSE